MTFVPKIVIVVLVMPIHIAIYKTYEIVQFFIHILSSFDKFLITIIIIMLTYA